MRKQPYIGVTGVTTPEEVEAVLKGFEEAGITMDTNHIPMMGILVSDKTLRQEQTADPRYPELSTIPDILTISGQNILSTIHYNTKNKDNLSEEISELLNQLGDSKENLGGFQFNLRWPTIEEIAKIKFNAPELKLILALTKSAMKDKTPGEIGQRVAKYGQTIDYTLIDPSGGKGEDLDLNSCAEIFKEVWTQNSDICIGIAGGLSNETVGKVCTEFMGEVGTPFFSIDVQGKLRDKLGPHKHEDKLNIEKFRTYALAAKKSLIEN